MKTLRLFISSPGDVAEEREKARQVVEALQRHYGSSVTLRVVMWEDLALDIDLSAQQTIEKELVPADKVPDIAVFILWSRLGSELSEEKTPRPGGGTYRSGTEHEFELMLGAREESGGIRPHILAYWRQDEESFVDLLRREGPGRYDELLRQKQLAGRFVEERFLDEKGRNVRGLVIYREPLSFAERLHRHLRQKIDELLGRDGDCAERWQSSPYRGLDVFDAAHAAIFHGREEETQDLVERLREQEASGCAYVVIVGASGAGKSSLARAGVAATLRSHSFDERVREWRHAVFLPSLHGGDLFTGLARTLAAILPELRGGAGGLERFAERLRGNREAAADLFASALGRAAEGARGSVRLLLVLDQMEELWTDRRLDEGTREAFLESLEALSGEGGLVVLATLRSDFYSQAQGSAAFLRMKGERGHFDLTPPGPAALQRLIVEPARLAGLGFERDERTGKSLDQVILADAAKDPAALPLLQDALLELYERRDEARRLLTYEAYEALGGVEGALARRAAETVVALPEEAREALEEVLPLLVSVDTAGEQNAVRRRAPLEELNATPARRELCEALVAARFLSTDEESGEAVAALAHEALLRRWDRVAEWVAANRDLLRMRARVEQYHAMWEQSGRDSSHLLPDGLPLAEGRSLIAHGTTLLDRSVTAFIEISSSYHLRKRRRAMAILGGLTTVAVLAGVVAWNLLLTAERRNAVIEKQGVQLRAEAEEQDALIHEASMAAYGVAVQKMETEGAWHEGLAHLAQSLELDPSNALAASRLHATIAMHAPEQENWPRTILHHGGPVAMARFVGRGALVCTAKVDGSVQVWNAVSDETIAKVSPVGSEIRKRAVFSRNGAFFLTSAGDGRSQMFETATLRIVGTLPYDSGACRAISSDGTSVVIETGFINDEFSVFHLSATGNWVAGPVILRGAQTFNAIAIISPDGKRIATASMGTARVWDLKTGELIGRTLHHGDGLISDATFSPDGTRLVTAASDGSIRIWDTASGESIGHPMRHEQNVHSANFSPDGNCIATASSDFTARIWDARTGHALSPPLRHDHVVFDANFSPDGARLVTSSEDSTAQVWDVRSGKALGGPLRHRDSVIGAEFNAEGTMIVTASADGTAQVWRAATGRPTGEPLHGSYLGIDAEFSADGSHFLSRRDSSAILVRDTVTRQTVGGALTHQEGFEDASFSPDGRYVVTTISDGNLQIWDAVTGKSVASAGMGDSHRFGRARFHPNSRNLVTWGGGSSARVWYLTDGEEIDYLGEVVHEGDVNSAQFSPDGRLLLTASADGSARLWNTYTRSQTGKSMTHQESVSEARFSPDGTRIVTRSADKTTQVWNTETQQKIGDPMTHGDEINSMEFSPDGSKVTTASDDRTARLWDAATGKQLTSPLRHRGDVNGACYSPDGTMILTASYDSTARIWDAATGSAIGERLQHGTFVLGARFSPDGLRVLTWDDDAVTRLWDTPKAASKLVPVPESVIEWARAVSGWTFGREGGLEPISSEKRIEVLRRPVNGEGELPRLVRWMALPEAERTVAPGSKLTSRQLAELERDTDFFGGVEYALRIDPTVPLARLLLSFRDEDPVRERFLRDYEFQHLPDDAGLWRRACETLDNAPTTKSEEERRSRWEACLMAADKSLTLEPGHPAALRIKAKALVQLDRLDDSYSTLQKLLALPDGVYSSDFADAMNLAERLGQVKEVGALFARMQKFPPTDEAALRRAGWVLLRVGAPAEAWAAFQAASSLVKEADQQNDLLFGIGVTAWRTGKPEESVSAFRRLLARMPELQDSETIEAWIMSAADKSEWQEIRRTALEKHPELRFPMEDLVQRAWKIFKEKGQLGEELAGLLKQVQWDRRIVPSLGDFFREQLGGPEREAALEMLGTVWGSLSFETTSDCPHEFQFDYKFEPEPGLRMWARHQDYSGAFWESYPSGRASDFRIVGRIEVEGQPGFLGIRVQERGVKSEVDGVTPDEAPLKDEDGSFQVFIPSKSSDSPVLRFRVFENDQWGKWTSLGQVEIIR